MNILLTNDDGYRAKGIRELAGILKEFGDVEVIAPKRHQSGMGMAVSLGPHPIAYKDLGVECCVCGVLFGNFGGCCRGGVEWDSGNGGFIGFNEPRCGFFGSKISFSCDFQENHGKLAGKIRHLLQRQFSEIAR